MAYVNPMHYTPQMEKIDSSLLEDVLSYRAAYDETAYGEEDVRIALQKDTLSVSDFMALLSPAALPHIEQIAQRSQEVTRRYFGNAIHLFTPLYLANYCENHCVYCGFHCHNKIKRARLSIKEMEQELEAIARTGLKEILLLTGESRTMSDIDYIAKACTLSRRYFNTVGVEVYPMNSDEYAYLHQAGCDYVTVFQETYQLKTYERLHLEGPKRIFPYRFHAQERAILGGMRGVGFAALLGIDDFRRDALATGIHAYLLQKKYPHAEISLSCPRLRPIIHNSKLRSKEVGELQLLQVLFAYRLFLPFATIVISSRESALFRDHVVTMGATKISAGVSVGIGGHEEKEKGDEQFQISDGRSVQEIYSMLLSQNLQPIMGDSLYVG